MAFNVFKSLAKGVPFHRYYIINMIDENEGVYRFDWVNFVKKKYQNSQYISLS